MLLLTLMIIICFAQIEGNDDVRKHSRYSQDFHQTFSVDSREELNKENGELPNNNLVRSPTKVFSRERSENRSMLQFQQGNTSNNVEDFDNTTYPDSFSNRSQQVSSEDPSKVQTTEVDKSTKNVTLSSRIMFNTEVQLVVNPKLSKLRSCCGKRSSLIYFDKRFNPYFIIEQIRLTIKRLVEMHKSNSS